jgi:phosphoadenosine phosphosulfate reductase
MTLQQLAFDKRTRLQVMVDAAIERLRMFCPPEGYYLAFSGGKDSQCIYHLAREAGVKFDARYNVTGIDPPELVYHMQRHYPDVKREPYERSMWQLIKEQGVPPTRTMRYCCAALKERGGVGRVVIAGVRAAESTRRKTAWATVTTLHKDKSKRFYAFDPEQGLHLVRGCPTGGKVVVAPILDWTDRDVWAYLYDRDIPYCSLYDEGFKRLGCIGCPMARKAGREKEFARWPKFKAAYIKTFEEMLRLHPDRNYRQPWTSGEEVFNWWVNC